MEWSQFDKGIFLVNVLGIMYNPKTKKILIGKRENDPYIKELSWCFPGGRPGYEKDLELYLKHEIKVKTGLDVNIKKVIFAKTYPEKREFLSIYYYCEVIGGKEKAGEDFKEIKWVKPTEVKKYFTTSLHQRVLDYLKTLK
jgi:ADP-ribose pyrophosphatase YjhB (NUDIX family)